MFETKTLPQELLDLIEKSTGEGVSTDPNDLLTAVFGHLLSQ